MRPLPEGKAHPPHPEFRDRRIRLAGIGILIGLGIGEVGRDGLGMVWDGWKGGQDRERKG